MNYLFMKCTIKLSLSLIVLCKDKPLDLHEMLGLGFISM